MDTFELLSDIAWHVGPQERPLTYQDFLEETLRKSIKSKKAKAAVLNSIETDPVYLNPLPDGPLCPPPPLSDCPWSDWT